MPDSSPRHGGLVVLAALLLSAPAYAGAQTRLTEHTLTAEGDEGARPRASIADVAWLAGRWVGEGLGARAEVIWLPPAGGAMAGVFRLVPNGEVEFYELVTILEEDGSLTQRLKHFGPDLVGWEEKDESVTFLLLRREEDTLWFDGLTVRRVGERRMRIWVALQSEGEAVREALFEYRRVGPAGVRSLR